MATGSIMPAPVFTGLDSNGDPVNGGLLYTYVAGTTTAQTTYSDVGLTTANANPVVLDSAGRATVFLTPGSSFKFVLKDSAGSTLWTADNINAVPASSAALDIDGTAGEALTEGDVVALSSGAGGRVAGRWYKADADDTDLSSLSGDVGMVVADIASGETGSIRLGGRITGLSALSAGTKYYASATAGALTSSAPANWRLVGVADTTTSVLLTPPPVAVNGATVSNLDAATLATGTVPTARLGSGTADATTYLRGDSSWASIVLSAYTTSGSGTVNLSASNGTVQFVNCTGTATVNLYAASGNAGYVVHVKLTGSGTVTIDGNASETIDGQTTQAFSQQYQCLSVLCDGSAWHII
ncbi:MAG: hypothetical protein VW405_01030 [Rhodospirillaceae bacterium]